jgi:NADH-quinone oxidoreductase subunit C
VTEKSDKSPIEPGMTKPGDEVSPNGGRPGNVPATIAAEAEVVGVRRGMFGQRGTGDTSGFGGLVRTIAMPGPSRRPYGGEFDAVADALAAALAAEGVVFGTAVEKVVVDRGELTLFVRRDDLVAVLRALRDDPDLRFELLSGVSGAHYPGDSGRELHALYHLLSITNNRRVRLEVTCPDADPHIPSAVPVYPTADWHERETWDFFGIQFDGHPALTRIEMPDDWPGHPQRKDYPLGGIPVEYKGATIPPPDTRRSYS